MEKLEQWTSMESRERKLTKWEKLSFVKSIIYIPIMAPGTALKHLFFPPSDSPGPARAVIRKVLKTITSIPIAQQLALLPQRTTRANITKYCLKHHLHHQILQLAHDTNIHFIGPRPGTSSAPNFILYFHGGGYVYPCTNSHVKFALRCAAAADATLAILEYELSPSSPCPRQLEQAVEALRYVLRLTRPENIILAGDSAGGHLIAGVLSWVMHPYLSPDEKGALKLEPGEKFRGVCLISPMLSFDWGKDSYARNKRRDYLDADSVFAMLEVFKPEEVSFPQMLEIPDLCPAEAPPGWWIDMPVERLLITIGSWEVFFDSAVEFAEKASRDSYEGTKVELVVGWHEWHDTPVVDPMFWLKESETSGAVMKWMAESRSGKCAKFEDDDGYAMELTQSGDYERLLHV